MNKKSRFEWQGIDTIRVGLEEASDYTKWLYLYPFQPDPERKPDSWESTAYRIKLIDSTILRLMGV